VVAARRPTPLGAATRKRTERKAAREKAERTRRAVEQKEEKARIPTVVPRNEVGKREEEARERRAYGRDDEGRG